MLKFRAVLQKLAKIPALAIICRTLMDSKQMALSAVFFTCTLDLICVKSNKQVELVWGQKLLSLLCKPLSIE